MSYPSLSGYYSSSAQASGNANNTNNVSGYSSSSRNANDSVYSSSLSNPSNSTQPTSYNSSGYGWSGQSAYANASAEQPNENYSQSSDYNYQRNNTYENQPTASMNTSYSQDYYSQAPMRQNQQSAHNQTEGLSNLAYASGLESANSRSSTTRSAQPYEMPSSQQQNRMRSPEENQTRYSVNPPATTSSSYPMRQQGSSSSASSNQMAMDAAAALAGAVGRRNANNVQHSNFNAPRESPNISNVRSTMSAAPRRTASPQINTVSHLHQPYASSQSQSQPQPQQQRQQSKQQSQQQQRVPPSPYNTTNSQSTARQVPPAPVSNIKSQQTSANQGSQYQYGTRSSPRNIRQTGSIAHLVTAAHEAESNERSPSPEASVSAPTFIDPTSIFDPYAQERERRRQAAERAAIEARKQADEDAKRKAAEDARAEEIRKQNEKEAAVAERKRLQDEAEAQKKQAATNSARSNSGSKRKSKEVTVSTTPAAQTEEERMAAELKAMMEKMKAYQSKDPSLFKKLWDDMRKPGPTATTTSVETPSPQLGQQSLPAPVSRPQENVDPEIVSEQPAAKKSTPRRSRKAQVGPDGQQLRLNGYPVVVEDNAEGLPDLGRFPAERRIRQTYTKRRTGDNIEEDGQIIGHESVSPPATAEQAAGTTTTTRTPGTTPAQTPSKAARATPAALTQAFPPPSASKSVGAATSTKPSSGTIWPLEKRNALTSTALKALKAIPENASIQITEEDLYKILKNNPSYIDLCQQLEGKGLKFHRGHFARELLNSVPDLKGSTPTSHPIPVSGLPIGQSGGTTTVTPTATLPQPATQATNLYQYSYPPPSAPQYGHVPPHSYPPPQYGPPGGQFTQPPHYGFGILHPPNQKVPMSSYSIAPNKGGFSARPQPPPGSKEAAARKRDFAELIDLTELGEDDNYVLPDKHPRLEGPDSGDDMDTDPFQAYQKSLPAPHNPPSGFFAPPTQPVQFNPQPSQPGQIQKQETFAEPKGQRYLLAKPLNKKEALRKQYYDPKTVARDILIATGRHPSERPLNVHLAGMLGKYIELDSDVDTFEWDEVDPGGPPIPKVEIADVPASKPRFKLGQKVHRKGRKLRLLHVADKARRPDKENHANGVASPTPQPATDTSTDASISKSPLLKDQLVRQAFKKPSSKLRHSLLASDEQATPAQFDPTKPPQVQSDHLPSKPPSTAKLSMTQESTPHRRRGRPLGSKNKFPSVAGLKAQASDLKVKVNVPHRESTPPTKEKFKCKWKKCSTVLHNLDILRKHIGRIHRPSSTDAANEGYTCWWKKCKYLKQDENTGDWITTKVFDHWEDWLKHIEKDHVTPIAVRWGDGPATSHVDPTILLIDRKKYLADQSGLETTPTIELANNQTYPPDTLNLTELDHRVLSTNVMTEKQKIEEAAYIAFMRAHGINIKKHEESREASREVLRSLAKRKEMIGAGIDRGGCTLVDEEFRATFEQNPGIRRVVGRNE